MIAHMGKDKSIFDEGYRSLVHELTQERLRLAISQGELASRIGLHQSDISKIEQLERRLDVLEFARILEVFRISDNRRLDQLVRVFLGMAP